MPENEDANPTVVEVVEVEEVQPVESDVDVCLTRETHDGSGLENDDESNLPESDFESFAEDGVEEN